MVALKNCKSELSYIIAELFNMCLKESCFADCWRLSIAVLVFKNVWEGYTAKTHGPISLLFVVSKVLGFLLT